MRDPRSRDGGLGLAALLLVVFPISFVVVSPNSVVPSLTLAVAVATGVAVLNLVIVRRWRSRLAAQSETTGEGTNRRKWDQPLGAVLFVLAGCAFIVLCYSRDSTRSLPTVSIPGCLDRPGEAGAATRSMGGRRRPRDSRAQHGPDSGLGPRERFADREQRGEPDRAGAVVLEDGQVYEAEPHEFAQACQCHTAFVEQVIEAAVDPSRLCVRWSRGA